MPWDQAEGNPGGITAQSLGKQALERLNTATAVCPTIPRTNSAWGTRHGQGHKQAGLRKETKPAFSPLGPPGFYEAFHPQLQAFDLCFQIFFVLKKLGCNKIGFSDQRELQSQGISGLDKDKWTRP